jgi:hypothetical protein
MSPPGGVNAWVQFPGNLNIPAVGMTTAMALQERPGLLLLLPARVNKNIENRFFSFQYTKFHQVLFWGVASRHPALQSDDLQSTLSCQGLSAPRNTPGLGNK